MTDIYDEVLADRKKLLEVAETNAKNKIVDAITPRIKELVESALLGKLNEDMPGDDDDILMGVVDGDQDNTLGLGNDATSPIPEPPTAPSSGLSGGDQAGLSLPGSDGKVTVDLDSLTNQPGGQFELTPESIKALNAIVGVKDPIDLDAIGPRVTKLEAVVKKIASAEAPSIKDAERARQIRVECQKIFSDIQSSRDFLDEAHAKKIETKLESVFRVVMERFSAAGHLTAIAKEMLAINRAAGSLNNRLNESRALTSDGFNAVANLMKETLDLHSSVRKLHESLGAGDDSVDSATVRQIGANLATLYTEIRKMVTKKGKQINEADELGVGGDGVADVDDEAAGVDAEKMLVQLELPASLKDIAAGDTVNVVNVSPAGDEDDMDMDMGMDMGADEDSGGALDDLEADVGDEAADEEDDMDLEGDEDMYEARLSDDDIIEIDEAALVAEMRNMKKLREKKSAKSFGGQGPGDLSDFGGGSDEGEKFVDGQELNQSDPLGSDGYLEEGDDAVDEADDLDEGDDELDEADAFDEEDYGVSGDKWSKKRDREEMGESHQKASRKSGQPKEKQLAEAVQAARAELAEQKLFNTKLVALNRVLQIPGLKRAQKEKVVEVLDKGRTVAEVQQLYGKIVGALKKDSSLVKESADRSRKGSGSKVTMSSAPSDKGEHPLLEKWNKIAFGGPGVIQG